MPVKKACLHKNIPGAKVKRIVEYMAGEETIIWRQKNVNARKNVSFIFAHANWLYECEVQSALCST